MYTLIFPVYIIWSQITVAIPNTEAPLADELVEARPVPGEDNIHVHAVGATTKLF